MDSAFFLENPQLDICRDAMFHAKEALLRCFREGGKLIVVGNGGSHADSLHICTELNKSFKQPRELSKDQKDQLLDLPFGRILGNALEGSLPAVALGANSSLLTALVNDKDDPRIIFAQELLGLAAENDLLWALSTSGESEDVIMATSVAKMKGMRIIGLTGPEGGTLGTVSDIVIKAPGNDTAQIQEEHIKIYHALCAAVELVLFPV